MTKVPSKKRPDKSKTTKPAPGVLGLLKPKAKAAVPAGLCAICQRKLRPNPVQTETGPAHLACKKWGATAAAKARIAAAAQT